MGGGQESVFQLGDSIGRTMGISYVKPDNKQVTMNTDSWKMAYELALKAIESGILYRETPAAMVESVSIEDFLLRDPFIAGRVAMTIDGSPLAEQIKQAQGMVADKAVSNWDLVTMPRNTQELRLRAMQAAAFQPAKPILKIIKDITCKLTMD
jgi:multiple sugar transport system substrate-binding protein